MIENEQKLAPEEKPQRDKKGWFLPGNKINPTGENGLKGLARYADRVNHFLDKLNLGELQAIVSNPEKMKEYSVRDAQILIHLARTLTGKEVGRERERMLNRTEGMPIQTIITHEDNRPLPEDIDKVSAEEAKRVHDMLLKENA